MRRVLALTFAALAMTCATAGDWQPDPDRRFQLNAAAEQPAEATASEDQWVQSLVTRLRNSGAQPNVVYRFAKAKAQFTTNGVERANTVFVLRDRPDLFLVTESADGRDFAHFLVDFAKHTVQVPGWGGAVFVPPSRSFCVAVFDGPNWLGGIPVTGDAENPKFSDRVASWY